MTPQQLTDWLTGQRDSADERARDAARASAARAAEQLRRDASPRPGARLVTEVVPTSKGAVLKVVARKLPVRRIAAARSQQWRQGFRDSLAQAQED